tara:strand:+ start:1269 stop:1835 length:567 start_codon:yes stop_codon:yes gene_type:complete
MVMNALVALDHDLFQWANAWGPGLLGVFFETVTWWGHFGVCGSVLILLMVANRRIYNVSIPWKGLLLYSALVSAAVVLMKIGFDRSRPAAIFGPDEFVVLGETLLRRSFPSGHTATAAWAFCVVVFIRANPFFSILFGALALLVGVSRIVVGAHFPADVLMGYLIAGGTFFPFYVRQASTQGEEPHGE